MEQKTYTAGNANASRIEMFNRLKVVVSPTPEILARRAARRTAERLTGFGKERGRGAIRMIAATAVSQVAFHDALRNLPEVTWDRIELFHMDEFVGVPDTHRASFRRMVREEFEERIPSLRAVHLLRGDADNLDLECDRYARLLSAEPIDLCCLGIGENGHIAFNDPPVADFFDERILKRVALDDTCKEQQVHDGAFDRPDEVPDALTLTIPTLMGARAVIGVVPGAHKAEAVRNALVGPISTDCPASILRTHPDAELFLDHESASLLD